MQTTFINKKNHLTEPSQSARCTVPKEPGKTSRQVKDESPQADPVSSNNSSKFV